SSMEYGMTIGLGKSEALDSIRIVWPDDRTQKLKNVKVNQQLTLDHADATETYKIPKKEVVKSLLSEMDTKAMVPHKEDGYNDFDYEGLIYQKLSQDGPSLAVADINGDGHEDFFIGGAHGQAGTI